MEFQNEYRDIKKKSSEMSNTKFSTFKIISLQKFPSLFLHGISSPHIVTTCLEDTCSISGIRNNKEDINYVFSLQPLVSLTHLQCVCHAFFQVDTSFSISNCFISTRCPTYSWIFFAQNKLLFFLKLLVC